LVRAWCRIFRGQLTLAGEDLDAMLAAENSVNGDPELLELDSRLAVSQDNASR
jgi:hypothetical protein